MRKLLNTLYILTPESYLSLDGENVVIQQGDKEMGRFPLHTLEMILSFSYRGASPALMGGCAKRGVGLCFFTPNGRFLARATGEERGNVLLRKAQYRLSDEPSASCRIARNFILGKIYNSRWSLERATRDHPMRVDVPALKAASSSLAGLCRDTAQCGSLESLRGVEGAAAALYFGALDLLILQSKEDFFFPPPASGPFQRPAFLHLYPPGQRLRRRLGGGGFGPLCGLSPPGPSRPRLPGPGPDGRAAGSSGGPLRSFPHQHSRHPPKGFFPPGKRHGSPLRRGAAETSFRLAGAQTGGHHPSLPGGKAALGAAAPHPGAAAGPVSPRGPGGISAIFLEMRGIRCWYSSPTM